MAYGHSSGLPPWEAPVMIAEKRNLFFSYVTSTSWQRAATHCRSTNASTAGALMLALQRNLRCHVKGYKKSKQQERSW